MTDLVVVSLEAWDDVWRRNQHLVAGLLRSDAALAAGLNTVGGAIVNPGVANAHGVDFASLEAALA